MIMLLRVGLEKELGPGSVSTSRRLETGVAEVRLFAKDRARRGAGRSMAASRRLESGVEEVSPLREGQSEKLEKEAKDIQGVMPDGGGGERDQGWKRRRGGVGTSQMAGLKKVDVAT